MERKLGELLVKDNIITGEVLEEALEKQDNSDQSLGRVLMDMGVATEWEIAAALGRQLNVPFITLSQYEIDREVLQSIPREIILKYSIVPVDRTGDTLTVALPDPHNIFILDELRLLTKCQIVPVISFEVDIQQAINRYFMTEDSTTKLQDMMTEMSTQEMEIIHDSREDDELDLTVQVNDAPVIRLVNVIIQEAIQDAASDIHVEPYEKTLRLRYRIDGVLQERPSPPKKFQNAILSRIKILSEMDIAERRMPQDGRFKVRLENKDIDFRVSSIPMPNGEKIVIRILDQSNLRLDLKDLGFTQEELDRFELQIHKPWGMILVTGPTGSGKSTTLYSALSTINTPTKNIITIEEPIEYQLYGINQVQAREDIGLTFAEGLRAFLRQDPDIIMVGEIRDTETVEVAIKAALTGHLVFSTLHTNDAPSSVTRLVNMGVEPFLVTASLNMLVAQRLVRRICKHCRDKFSPPADICERIGMEDSDIEFFRGQGCNECRGTGYRGRVALYEIMTLSDTIRGIVMEGANSTQIKKLAMEEGMRSLRQSGMLKIREGVTTIEEVLASTAAD
ncbi:type IV-A pilus assembly ATPase PilB [Candidatus Sumerlaeota bacterium]|nr:type IV-A pilus assembly ATPase PilB [Candidatus Sumerlaeota bacterium]